MSANNSKFTRITQVAFKSAILSLAIALASGSVSRAGSANAVPSEKPPKPLVASTVFLSDFSWCYNRLYNEPDYFTLNANAPCPAGTKVFPSTLWTFSVTNPNAITEARDVRARVILSDANNVEIMNKVFTVSVRLAPGATTWVAPLLSSVGQNYLEVVEASEGRGLATSGSVTILEHKWSTKKSGRRSVTRVETRFTASTCDAGSTFFSNPVAYCSKLSLSGYLPNPGAPYSGITTFVFFSDNGTPVGGWRSFSGKSLRLATGGSPFDGSFKVPGSFVKRFGSVALFFAP